MLRIFLAVILLSSAAFAEDREPGLYNQSELGYVVTGGNAESETTSVKQKSEYLWLNDKIRFTGHYIQASGLVDTPTPTAPNAQSNRTTAENWSAALRYDRVITPKWFNAYLGYGWRGDRFQGVSEGQDIDFGGTYFTANKKEFKHFFELGYRYTREFYTADPRDVAIANGEDPTTACSGVGQCRYPEFHYIRIFTQADYAYSKTFTMGLWFEYLPSITNFSEDQRINFSPYITSVLTDIFSLKVAYESRYRFKAAIPGNEYTDFTFTTSLLANF